MKIEEINGKITVTDFDELEAYRIAYTIEQNGISFYKKLAASTRQPETKKVLAFLQNEEAKHIKFFDKLLSTLREEKEDASEDNDLLTSMNFGVFEPYQSMEELSEVLTDNKKALRLGVAIENKSIQFYQACREHVSSDEAKQHLNGIILEEEKHKALLEGLLSL